MLLLQPFLATLLQSLPSGPVEQLDLNEAVKKAIQESKKLSGTESTRRSQWEFLLKNEVFNLAMTEGKALKADKEAYYSTLRRLLDVALTFTEQGKLLCLLAMNFPTYSDLLETQTITSCSNIFAWIETRSARLTVDLKPQKGKALVLLRSLNDLLRRLSKTGATTMFCGRILTFLSGVFPLGERSGVNLRGEYGPVWEGVGEPGRKRARAGDEEGTEAEAMQVDESEEKKAAQSAAEKKEGGSCASSSQTNVDFANGAQKTFPAFKESVNKVLPVIKEATAKERAMMGSRTGSGAASALKRKREPEPEEVNSTNQEYFFAKFLTSPDLIDLEVADTHFRRQFLFQLLILLHHLLTFTKTAKAIWTAPNNRALQMDFTLEPADAQWVQDTINRATEELRQTTPNGRAFSEAVSVILEREKNWVGWKNLLCAPFDKESVKFPLGVNKVGSLFEATSGQRAKMREPPEEYPWSHGSEALSEIWEMGCRGLSDLEQPFQPGEVKDFVKKVKLEDHRIEMRKKALIKEQERRAKATPPPRKVETPPVKVEPTPTPKAEEPLTPKPSTPAPSDTLATPQPTNPGGSPLHPSLPAKPGSSSPMKLSSSQEGESSEPPAIVAPTPTPADPTPVLAPTPTPAPEAPPVEPKPVPVLPPDNLIAKYEEVSIASFYLGPRTMRLDSDRVLLLSQNKQRWAWIALRTARDQHLQHFGKIGTGDIELLAKEIELEKERLEQREKGEEAKGEEVNGNGVTGSNGISVENGLDSPMTSTVPPPAVEKMEGEDVRMEDA
ncbi:hypothetical protein C0991_004552 [Blastosporella zonata]|nr:hypothetical protein C0991_004552 [Blastosporella zonata]